MTTVSSVAAWIYPGSTLVNGQSHVPVEFSDGRQIQVLKPQYYAVQSDGTLLQNTVANSGVDGYTAANAAQVQRYSVKQFVTISGRSPGIGALAGSSANLTSFNNTLVAFLQANSYTGIELDFEEPPWTVAKFNDVKTVVNSLGSALHSNGFKLMVDGPALTGTSAWDWSAFNSLPVDYVTPLVYDHMYDTSGAGDPITPFSWLTSVCNWMLSQISNHAWIVIGLPSYGYYGATGTYNITDNVTYVLMQQQPGFSTATRDPNSGELRWTNSGNSYVYCDATSINQKISTVTATGLSQISIWSLGGNNPWPTVQLVPPASSPTINGVVQDTDTFGNRASATGLSLGTASGGDTWNAIAPGGTTATLLAINAAEGVAFYDNSGGGGQGYGYAETVLSTIQTADTEVLCRFAALSASAGHFGLFTRYLANSHWYRCDVNVGGNTIRLAKMVAGVFTDSLATTSITITVGTYYWCRFRTQGNTVEAKIWADGVAEPGSWTVTVTDASLTTTTGQVGLLLVPIATAPGGGIVVDSFTASTLANVITLSTTLNGLGKFKPTLLVGGTMVPALYTVRNGMTIQVNDLNQVINVLQRAAGGIEIGTYFLEMSCYTSGCLVSDYRSTMSTGTTPVSITIDTSTQSPVAMGSPNVSKLSWAGFQVWGTSTAANGNARCGGRWIVQY